MTTIVTIFGKKQLHQWLLDTFSEIRLTLKGLKEGQEKLMADVTGLNAKADALAVVLGNIGGDVQSLKDQIAAIPVGSVVTQQQLDDLDAKFASILASAQGLDASVP